MKKSLCILPFIILLFNACSNQEHDQTTVKTKPKYALVIHGGAGTVIKEYYPEERQQQYVSKLEEALQTGVDMLDKGASAVETVEQVLMIMENSPLFNAGKGAVFSNDSIQEMDASIMDGKDLSSGAVTGVTHLKNPIVGARLVKDSTRHVMLSGARAEAFCLSKGAAYAPAEYFYTESAWNQLMNVLKKDASAALDVHTGESRKYGTVGCVVLDAQGNIAAGTSTGGLTNKKYGRIGDSPVIGAGTYADNNTCGVSCTGTGEYFIRGTIARDIAAIMEYTGATLEEAADKTMNKLNKMKGAGGFVSLDKNGNYSFRFNTPGMFRGAADDSGILEIKMFGEEGGE